MNKSGVCSVTVRVGNLNDNPRVGLSAKTQLNRKDYGINYHEVLETGAMAVGEEVELEINTEAVKEVAKAGAAENK